MPDQLHAEAPSMSSLVEGIIHDARELIRQGLTLARREIQDDFNDLKTSGAAPGAGGVVCLLAGFLLCMVPVYLLYEVAHLPLWASFLIVGAVVGAVGGFLLY